MIFKQSAIGIRSVLEWKSGAWFLQSAKKLDWSYVYIVFLNELLTLPAFPQPPKAWVWCANQNVELSFSGHKKRAVPRSNFLCFCFQSRHQPTILQIMRFHVCSRSWICRLWQQHLLALSGSQWWQSCGKISWTTCCNICQVLAVWLCASQIWLVAWTDGVNMRKYKVCSNYILRYSSCMLHRAWPC